MTLLSRHRRVLLLLAATLAGLALAGRQPASGGTITVDPVARTVETSRFFLGWNSLFPDDLEQVVYKDYDVEVALAENDYSDEEFWGQSYRNLNTTGYALPNLNGTRLWQVTSQTARFVQITTTSQTLGLPRVITKYTILADQPYFVVDRTIQFSGLPDTASYQAYIPRLLFLTDYHAVRWRNHSGTLVQRGFCIMPCLEQNWDGHWVQLLGRGGTGQPAVGITSIYPPGSVTGLPLVRGTGPLTPSGWVQPRVPAGSHATDVTWSQMLAFSTAPDDLAAIDALYTAYASGAALAGVEATAKPVELRLEVAPNPAFGPTALAWTNPVAGDVTLDVLDVAGRRIARLRSGACAAGTQRTTWDGRDDHGARVPPGLYLARLATPAGLGTSLIVRTH